MRIAAVVVASLPYQPPFLLSRCGERHGRQASVEGNYNTRRQFAGAVEGGGSTSPKDKTRRRVFNVGCCCCCCCCVEEIPTRA